MRYFFYLLNWNSITEMIQDYEFIAKSGLLSSRKGLITYLVYYKHNQIG